MHGRGCPSCSTTGEFLHIIRTALGLGSSPKVEPLKLPFFTGGKNGQYGSTGGNREHTGGHDVDGNALGVHGFWLRDSSGDDVYKVHI